MRRGLRVQAEKEDPQPQVVWRSIADHELRTLQAFGVVHLGPVQVLQAQRIDQQHRAVAFHRDVVLGLLFVEFEAVLEARAATAGNVDAQLEIGVAFLADQLADLGAAGR